MPTSSSFLRLLACASVFAASLVCAQPASEDPSSQFNLAYEHHANGFYLQSSQGFEAFRSAYPQHPNAPDALYYEAEAMLSLGAADEATALFTQFERRYPEHPLAARARLALGHYFYQRGDYQRTISTLGEVVMERPAPEVASKALYWMGQASLREDRFDAAVQYFEQAAEDYRDAPTAPVALYAIGQAYVDRAEYREAVSAFERLKARYPDNPYVESLGLALAEAYYEIGDYQRVIDEIERQMRRLDDSVKDRATFLLAESYNQLRDHTQAIVYYRRFTEDNQDSPYYRRALYGLAWNYHFQGAYQWAYEHFEQAQRGFTDSLANQAMYYQGVNLRLSNRLDEAADTYAQVVRVWPNEELADDAQFELGMMQYELRRWKEAGEAFGKLIDDYSGSPYAGEALRMQGESFVAQGNFNRAFDAYDQAIDRDAAPVSLRQEVGFQKAWLLYRQDDFATAGPAFMTLYEQDSEGEKAGDALFWAAESFYQAGSSERAIRLFNQFVQTFPEHKQRTAAHYALGWANFRAGRFENAARQYATFLRRYRPTQELIPYGDDARLRLGDSYFALKQYEQAISAYRQVEGDDADYAHYRVGQALSLLSRPQEAIAQFESMPNRYPYSEWREEALYASGYLKFLQPNYEGAIADYQSLVTRYPAHPLAPRAQYGIADSYYNSGDLTQALGAYSSVLNGYPDSDLVIDAFGGVQYTLVALEREAAIDSVLNDFASRQPNSPMLGELRFRNAEIKFQNAQLEDAAADFERLVQGGQLGDRAPDAYVYLGNALIELGQTDEAERYLKQLVERFPAAPARLEGQARLGALLLEQNRDQEALAVYESLDGAATGNPRYKAEALYGRGLALLSLGRAGEAELLLKAVVDATSIETPEGLPARLGLARVYQEQGRTSDALRLYEMVAEESLDETGAESLYRLGTLLTEQGLFTVALEELGKMPVLFGAYPDWEARGYLAQGQIYEQLGEGGNADRVYDLVLERFPGTDFAEEAERRKASL